MRTQGALLWLKASCHRAEHQLVPYKVACRDKRQLPVDPQLTVTRKAAIIVIPDLAYS